MSYKVIIIIPPISWRYESYKKYTTKSKNELIITKTKISIFSVMLVEYARELLDMRVKYKNKKNK